MRLVLALALTMCIASLAEAQQITSVSLFGPTGPLIVSGTNLGSTTSATFGGINVGVGNVTPTQVNVGLPSLQPGTFKLVLKKNANTVLAEFVVTIGVQGPQGPVGPIGLTGPVGATGPAGAQGAPGAQGPVGATGAQGLPGNPGAQGVQGLPGATGAQGEQGPAGATGPQGATGPAGTNGPAGPEGPAGATGAQGPAGPQGSAGPAGPEGPAGATGPEGAQGVPGPQGPEGPAGSGVSGHEIIWELVSGIAPAGDTLIGIASCSTGKKVLGGGFVLQGSPQGYVPAIMGSYPTSDTTWRINMKNTTAAPANLSYYVFITCATAQ